MIKSSLKFLMLGVFLTNGASALADIPIYSLYHPGLRDHMISLSEFEAVRPGAYQAEGYHFSLSPFEPAGGGVQLYRCYHYQTSHHYVAAWACNSGDETDTALGWAAQFETPSTPFALVGCYRADIDDHMVSTDENECYNNGYDVVAHFGFVGIDYGLRSQHVFVRYGFPVYVGPVIIRHERPEIIRRDRVVVIHDEHVDDRNRHAEEDRARNEDHRRAPMPAPRRDERERRRP